LRLPGDRGVTSTGFVARLLRRLREPRRGRELAAGDVGSPRKWLPIIDTESCGGCGRCVKVCPTDCIELVWSFATLERPADCTGEGLCSEVCPEEVIRMGWVPWAGGSTAELRSEPAADAQG
jgi:NAD-dependent dihydropyrimidine dehydrogenase PreA subunit